MPVKTTKAMLLDTDYITEDGKSIIRLFVRNGAELEIFKDAEFHPYFYVIADDAKKAVEEIKEMVFDENSKVKDAEIFEKKSGPVIKVSFNLVQELIKAREKITELPSVLEKHEYDIPFAERYLIDKMLEPMNGIEIKSENGLIESVKSFDSDFDFKLGAFDLETYAKGRFSDPKKDRILMASYADGKDDVIFTDKKAMGKIKYVKVFESEKQIIEKLIEKIKKENLDLLVTYNGDSFDMPYITERAHIFNLKANLGSDGSEPRVKRMGMDNAVQLRGVQHFDAYRLMRMLGRFAVVDLIKYDLESVNQKIFGDVKEKITAEEMMKIWDSEKELERLADYNLEDSKVTLKLAKEYLPLIVELCKLVKLPVFMVNRSSASTLVERLLLNKCFETETLVPNRPEGGVISQRMMQSFSGGFVREPQRGLHENLAVLDFSSLHPTIIISHNISPETMNCNHKECEKNKSPTGQGFCTKKEGFLSSILQDLFNRRMEIKKKLKTTNKNDKQYNILNSRQHALKIILNSFYGYLGYARSRWYSRECAQAVTSWSQHYVKWVGEEADKEGFETIYADSITNERFVTLQNPKGQIEVKNIEELFEGNIKKLKMKGTKEVIKLRGYKALSYNFNKKRCEWQNINEIIRHKTDKKIYRINQKFGETRATEDHSLITDGKNGIKETKPLEMKGRKMIKLEKIPHAKELRKIDLFEFLKPYSTRVKYKNRIKIAKVHKNKKYVWFAWTNQKNQIKIKRFINVNSREFKALCRLLGAYIAEGSSSTIETTKTKRGASIASSNIKWLEDLKKNYELLFINTKTSIIPSMRKIRTLQYMSKGKIKTIKYKDKSCKLQMMNATTAVFFKMMCGQKSDGKKLPTFIFNVPNKYKKILLDKIIEGDGCKKVSKAYSENYKKKNFRLDTKSLQAISGISLLLTQLNQKHTIRYRKEKNVHSIQTSSKYNTRLETKVKKETYNGYVYDLNVEKNNNFVDSCGQILLHNTDSAFLLIKDKTQKDVTDFIKKINSKLPGIMNLDLQGFYKRAIFVTNREGTGTAKKRYALIDEKDNLKIVGFEYVRRDWSGIAKETQKNVIEAVLKEGKPERAVQIVRDVVIRLKKGKVPNKELLIYTQIKKPLAKYDAIGPHVAAAKKAIARGKVIDVGSVIEYVVTKTGKSISDRAELVEFVKEGNYDADYYIENQVIPAVIRILAELGYDKQDLIQGGKQHTLNSFC